MTSKRAYPLHNFKLPSRLKWGTQKYLRCKKPESEPPRSDHGSQIDPIGYKLLLDLKLGMEKIEACVGADVENVEKEKVVENGAGDGVEAVKPWNLRSRRSPKRGTEGVEKRVRGGGGSVEEKVEFRVGLKREEVEEDFLMMSGAKPPRRPKKRPRGVQKQLDVSEGFFVFDFILFL